MCNEYGHLGYVHSCVCTLSDWFRAFDLLFVCVREDSARICRFYIGLCMWGPLEAFENGHLAVCMCFYIRAVCVCAEYGRVVHVQWCAVPLCKRIACV